MPTAMERDCRTSITQPFPGNSTVGECLRGTSYVRTNRSTSHAMPGAWTCMWANWANHFHAWTSLTSCTHVAWMNFKDQLPASELLCSSQFLRYIYISELCLSFGIYDSVQICMYILQCNNGTRIAMCMRMFNRLNEFLSYHWTKWGSQQFLHVDWTYFRIQLSAHQPIVGSGIINNICISSNLRKG